MLLRSHIFALNSANFYSLNLQLFVQSPKSALSENLQKTIEMTNHVAKLIKNEKSIKTNFIDEYIWREDEHFEYTIGNEPVSLK